MPSPDKRRSLRSSAPARRALPLLVVLAASAGLAVPVAGQSVVTGRVTDISNGAPLHAATVRIGRSGAAAETGRDGRFRLAAVPEGATLEVVRLGYLPRSMPAPAGGGELVVEMEPDVFDLTGVTVTATRSERAVLDQPSNVAVVERAEVERRMMTTIEDVARYQPGVSVLRQTSGTDPFNSFQGFTIRGVSGNRVQMVVDGSRVQERIIDGTRDLVDPANMKAVEIVRGPASALWGSDALGGLVAFETKDPEDYLQGPDDRSGAQGDFSYSGLNGETAATVAIAGRSGPLRGLVSYSRRDAHETELTLARSEGGIWPCTRSAEATPCDRLDPTTIASNNVLGKLVYETGSSNHRVELTGEVFDRATEVDQAWDLGPVVSGSDTTALQTSYARTQDLDRWRAQLQHEWRPGSSFVDEVRWSVTHHPQSSLRTGDRRRTLLPSNDLEQRLDTLDYVESFTELDLQVGSSFATGPARHLLTFGFDGGLTETDYSRVDVTNNLTTGDSDVARAGGFNFANADTRRFDGYLQDEIELGRGRLAIVPAVRVAHYDISPLPDGDYQPVEGAEPRDIAETSVTPKIGVIVRDGFMSFYGHYARGFKMPTAQQLYTSLPGAFFVLVPNPELQPEEVDAWELGVRAEGRRGFLSINGFFNDYTDFIQSFVFVPDTDPQEITYDNLSSVAVYGVEASAAWRWTDRLASTVSASWQRGDYVPDADTTVTQAFDTAEPMSAFATLRWADPGLGIDAELNGTFQAGTERVSSPDVYQPAGYSVFGAVVEWSPLAHLTLRGSVENLFDRRYLLPSATAYGRDPASDAVAATNPIELQVQPGRHFRLGVTVAY